MLMVEGEAGWQDVQGEAKACHRLDPLHLV